MYIAQHEKKKKKVGARNATQPSCMTEAPAFRKEKRNTTTEKGKKRSLGYKVYPQHPDGAVWLDHGCLVASDCTVVHSISMEMDG